MAIIAMAMIASLALTSCAELARQGGNSGSASESALVARVNGYRAARGLAPLAVHGELQRKAQSWAAHMAAGGCGTGAGGVANICHSNLSDGITVQWARLAENVGYVSPRDNVDGMQAAFENSAPHAANMANGEMDYIGIGVAYRDNMMYVAEVFMAVW